MSVLSNVHGKSLPYQTQKISPRPLSQALMFTGTLILTYSAQLVKVVP